MDRNTSPPTSLDESDFVSKPVNKDFFCPVSLEVMTNPHQTDCCGSHISAGVAERLTKEEKPCPVCKAPTLTTHRDQFFQRIILNEKVRCLHGINGCNWIGPLRESQNHSASCKFHPWVCQYCKNSTYYEKGTTEHAPICPKRPVICPCSSNHVSYSELEEHGKVCPTEVVACEFADVGCTVKLPRSNISEHLQSSIAQHNLLVSRKTLDMLLAAQPSSSSHGPRLPFEAPSQQLREKDSKIMELQNSVRTLSADLKCARGEIARLQEEKLQTKVLTEGSEEVNSEKDHEIKIVGDIVTNILEEMRSKSSLNDGKRKVLSAV